MIRQIIRGCGTLPHVGEHPGTVMLVGFIICGALAAAHRGWNGALGGALIMAIGLGPFYLWGAYDRAQLSDELSKQNEHNQA